MKYYKIYIVNIWCDENLYTKFSGMVSHLMFVRDEIISNLMLALRVFDST